MEFWAQKWKKWRKKIEKEYDEEANVSFDDDFEFEELDFPGKIED
jgi:hypothetical protein